MNGTVAPLALRPVVCVIDTLHRDLAVADDARRGRFTHAGTTLTLGRTPDWLSGGLVDDEEWRIEWVKQYEGLDLAHAYVAGGDDDHLAAWEDLVGSYCLQVPVGHDTSDVDARRVQNWIYAWQRFATSPRFGGLRPGLAERIVARLVADVDHIAAHLTPERNHRTLELYAVLIASIALEDTARAALALDLLADNAAADIGDDGVQRERSSDYHMIVLRSLLGAITNANAVGLPTPPGLAHRVTLACTFGLHLQRPDGTTPALSDGDQADFRPLLADAAAILGRPDLEWAATGGTAGTPPADRLATFPHGGYATQRSGWGDRGRAYADERWAVIDCGPLGDGGHGHYDHLSVELAAGGRPLAVDPGRFTYAEGPWRRWFKGTAAHNTVCVDGLDQQPYRRGKPKGEQSNAWLVARHTVAAGTDDPHGLACDAIVARCTSPRYDAVHTRTLVLVDDDYWVVVDRLASASEHTYVARWHLDPAAQGRTMLHRRGGLSVVHLPGGTISVPDRSGTVELELGWVSPSYGVRHPAPVVATTTATTGAGEALVVTVVAPGERSPSAIDVDGGPGDDVTGIVVRWATAADRLTLTGDASRAERVPC